MIRRREHAWTARQLHTLGRDLPQRSRHPSFEHHRRHHALAPPTGELALDSVANFEAQVLELVLSSLFGVQACLEALPQLIVIQILSNKDQLAEPLLILFPFNVKIALEYHMDGLIDKLLLGMGDGQYPFHSKNISALLPQQIAYPLLSLIKIVFTGQHNAQARYALVVGVLFVCVEKCWIHFQGTL